MSTSSGINVFLIRHGESLANAGHVTSDPTSIPLTAQGWAQARHVAASFEHAPSLIITSSYLRTQQTAQPTRARFPHVPHAVWPVHEFTYLSLTRCINLTAAQRRPLAQDYWQQCDITYVDGLGAESFASLIERAENTLRLLQEQVNGDIAIFTHGQFMQMLRWLVRNPSVRWSSHTMQAWRRWMLDDPIHNTHVIPLQYSHAKGWTVGHAYEM